MAKTRKDKDDDDDEDNLEDKKASKDSTNGSDDDDEDTSEEDSTINNGGKKKKKEKPKPKIKWKRSKAKRLLYEDIQEGRVPGEVKDSISRISTIYGLSLLYTTTASSLHG
jgi:hypothetical protein